MNSKKVFTHSYFLILRTLLPWFNFIFLCHNHREILIISSLISLILTLIFNWKNILLGKMFHIVTLIYFTVIFLQSFLTKSTPSLDMPQLFAYFILIFMFIYAILFKKSIFHDCIRSEITHCYPDLSIKINYICLIIVTISCFITIILHIIILYNHFLLFTIQQIIDTLCISALILTIYFHLKYFYKKIEHEIKKPFAELYIYKQKESYFHWQRFGTKGPYLIILVDLQTNFLNMPIKLIANLAKSFKLYIIYLPVVSKRNFLQRNQDLTLNNMQSTLFKFILQYHIEKFNLISYGEATLLAKVFASNHSSKVKKMILFFSSLKLSENNKIKTLRTQLFDLSSKRKCLLQEWYKISNLLFFEKMQMPILLLYSKNDTENILNYDNVETIYKQGLNTQLLLYNLQINLIFQNYFSQALQDIMDFIKS